MLPLYLAVAYYLILTRVIPGIYQNWKRRRQLTLPRRVVLFTRYPTPGKTKTRLIPALGASGAAHLQLLMSNHIMSTLKKAQLAISNLCIEVRYYGGSEQDMDYWIGSRGSDPVLVYRKQEGADLGERMSNALLEAMKEGAQTVLIVGSDIPGISPDLICEGFKLIEDESSDIILGPAIDGGYYTVGASARAEAKISQLFKGIDWGTDKVLQQQIEAGSALGLKLKLLATELNDIDHNEDLPIVQKCMGISKTDILKPHWSIVIPVLNESHNLNRVIRTLVENADSPERLEIVLADGQSTDNPEKVVEELRNEFKGRGVKLKLITCSQRGRGVQLNEGAAATSHKLLMFIHADSQLPVHYDSKATNILTKPGVTAGAFHFGLDVIHVTEKRKEVSWWFLQQMKLLEWGTKRRSIHYELPYGDQGLFMWRNTFDSVGGYPMYRLMEDYEMVARLKKIGHIGFVEGMPLLTSARRWQKHGYLKITGMNTFIIMAYKCGVHPNTLARWYYGQ